MPPSRTCQLCYQNRPSVVRSATRMAVCKPCFFQAFEEEVYQTIVNYHLFSRNERVVLAVSGGKDSTVLAEVLTILNDRYEMKMELFLLAIDEGIQGYRDDSLNTLRLYQQRYKLPLKIYSYSELYDGWTMDEIVKKTGGRRSNCTFCGVFRRQALDKGAKAIGAHKLCTGHNADDCAETVLMNLLRGDIARLVRCADVVSGVEGDLPRCKPLMFQYEKEIVLYAHFKGLEYFSTECTYSPNAYRGNARDLVKKLEAEDPMSILRILHSARHLQAAGNKNVALKEAGSCRVCGAITSNDVCKACSLVGALNEGRYDAAVVRSRKSGGGRENHGRSRRERKEGGSMAIRYEGGVGG